MITLIWTPSHKTHQESLKRHIPLEHWVANTIADSLAGKGAEESALEQEQIDLILGNEKKVHNILRRLVSIAVAIVPVGKHTACSANKGPCRGSGKLEGLERLARASGHSLTSLFKCVKCSLQLDLSLHRAYLDNILTMPCLGNIKESVVKHARNADPDAILVFNRTEAHSSHTMASAPALRIHFCVACGCYAGTRSKGLKHPCARFPKKAGKEALAAIAVGKQPNAAAYSLCRRLGRGAWVSRYSKGNGLACR